MVFGKGKGHLKPIGPRTYKLDRLAVSRNQMYLKISTGVCPSKLHQLCITKPEGLEARIIKFDGDHGIHCHLSVYFLLTLQAYC